MVNGEFLRERASSSADIHFSLSLLTILCSLIVIFTILLFTILYSMDRPSKIVCVGRNYLEHARELGNTVPEEPLIFLKPPSSLIAGGEPVVLPAQSSRVEYEGEIAVVIGARARNVSAAESVRYIGGYAPLNDVTARDLQRSDDQWTRAKGFDTFCPMGEMVAAEGLDPARLEVICRLNGEVRQHGRAKDMAFSIPTLIEYITSVMTLEPGDVIATGTPSGVGALKSGDVVEVEIPGVGKLSNPVV
ncbi:MAG: 2-hydroxyhepta-2,4-diene-1,7-dioate isomerase [Gemmatimonas sp.]|nr:2-hydroxyhepta-2,4-diene-1,7-dioate isomerase [Gemmatimonas sp.]